MDVTILGAGPAGLYAAILIKRVRPTANVQIIEQNPADATWGFGVVFSDQALAFLRRDDPETADLIEPEMETWSNIVVRHRGEQIEIDGVGFSAIGRLEFLKLLQRRAAELRVQPEFETRIDSVDALPPADLVIAADGLNSIIRAADPEAFGESLSYLDNRFVWYGATKPFNALTQTFKSTRFGPFNAHHYRYAPDRSTFIVECSAETFDKAGFEHLSEDDSKALCAEIFAEELDGAELISNKSIWRRFPVLKCSRWHRGNQVLVGDALHTAHFSIGSGTRLALEDVIALVQALQETDFYVADALPLYQAARQPILNKIVRAAETSAGWYEDFGTHMSLEPWPFALSYIRRAGRLDADRLKDLAPNFVGQLEQHGVGLELAS
ncbi:MAG: FAD-dependent monooxygenase [Pseudomonadota bacterium]